MQFSIDEKFICDQTIKKTWGYFDKTPVDQLTPEQLFKILKGEDRCSSVYTQDHPEFSKLRDMLEEQGFIKTERGWWNGDRVLRPFKLNEWSFKKGHKFPCAAAMKNSIHCARKYGWKSISSI